jgi:hypothetical protein
MCPNSIPTDDLLLPLRPRFVQEEEQDDDG